MNNREVEFKYRCSGLSVDKFTWFCETRKPINSKIISGYDHFYAEEKDKSSFFRHRISCSDNQLTYKKKINEDIFIREERNIDLGQSISREQVTFLCDKAGYYYKNSIFKVCFIYNYDYYTLVHYICYDKNMKELGRFVEIEMKEDYPWTSELEAFNELVALEKICSPLGISSKVRVKESLFEMYGDIK